MELTKMIFRKYFSILLYNNNRMEEQLYKITIQEKDGTQFVGTYEISKERNTYYSKDKNIKINGYFFNYVMPEDRKYNINYFNLLSVPYGKTYPLSRESPIDYDVGLPVEAKIEPITGSRGGRSRRRRRTNRRRRSSRR